MGTFVETMVHKRIPDHKIWMEAVFNVVKFSCSNGLPFRGHDENTDFISGGVYLNTFSHLLFQINPDLEKISKKLSNHAKYSSPDIQNEIIDVIAKLTQRKLSAEVKAVEIFTIMADGSTDKNGKEIEGFAVRYIDMEKMEVKEHCIDIVQADDRSASGIMSLLLESARKIEVNLEGGVVSQSYDGASVMSVHKSGLQALLNSHLGRLIIYIHCFCHRLALVVKDALNSIPFIHEHYSMVSSLYKHFKLKDISDLYDGNSLKRLIETRWSGHLATIKAIDNDLQNVINCLYKYAIPRLYYLTRY